MKKERFIGLEWMRFLLGLYIVIFHTMHYYPETKGWGHLVTQVGFFSTSTFFVLSGFLLTHVYLNEHNEMREPARSFMVKRFSNLYPIHIGSFLLTIAVMSLIPYLAIVPEDAKTSALFTIYDVNNDMGQATPNPLHHFMSTGEAALNVVLNLTLLHAWNPYYLTFNPPSWSISTLFFFYMVFPFAATRLVRLRKFYRAMALVMAIYLIPTILVSLYTDYGMPETGILHRNPIIRLPEFLAGILLCGLYTRRRSQGRRLSIGKRWALVGLIVVSIAIAEVLLTKGHVWYYFMHNGLLLPAQLALVYLCLFMPMPKRASITRFATRLGGASLPMFALHVPFYIIFSRVERVLSGEPSLCMAGEFRQCFDAAGPISIWYYPVFLILTVALCVVFQEQFVVRVRNWLQRHLLKQ
ncbi:acyltransferase family protein [Larsenimonas suaedae]|uniref:Acyltransferase n=1 Tax=Larsenimonas suaedae TaxID=1851019 RepID=A0ABU1GUT2_9GAMM|nr:acyltransferase [Larsenimonas suaedae]MCM2971064.1 acyltransferase [Larsenimonas suaedae]MDR5895773.1 acyltransferase [Larsenimonas suaedae]